MTGICRTARIRPSRLEFRSTQPLPRKDSRINPYHLSFARLCLGVSPFLGPGSGSLRMSLSLQANWQDQSFYVWARVGAGDPPVDAAALRAALGEVCSDALLASTVREGVLALSLPAGRAPQAERLNEDHGGVATHVAAGVETVRVPALVLNPAEAIDFLTSLPRDLPPVCGPSV